MKNQIEILEETLRDKMYAPEQADKIIEQVKNGDYAFVTINGRRIGLTTKESFSKMNITKETFIELAKKAKGFGGSKIISLI